MKNIHLIPTNKPSRLYEGNLGELVIIQYNSPLKSLHIYITSDEEIKEGDWVLENTVFERTPYIGKTFYPKNDGTVTDEVLKRDLLSVNYKGHYETIVFKHNCKKIILTTDQDLIADGIQDINDDFLEWFVKNPSCEEVEVTYGLLEPFKSEDKGYLIHCPDNDPKEEPKPHSFCETPEEKCTMNYCDENGCQNRKRILVEKPKQETLELDNNFYEKLKQYFEETPREKVLEDWVKSAEFDKIGPTVDDYLSKIKNQVH